MTRRKPNKIMLKDTKEEPPQKRHLIREALNSVQPMSIDLQLRKTVNNFQSFFTVVSTIDLHFFLDIMYVRSLFWIDILLRALVLYCD